MSEQESDNERRDQVASGDEDAALLSRLRVVEDQPLESRAEQLTSVYEELRRALEDSDPASTA